MTPEQLPRMNRLEELLLDQAIYGLDQNQTGELEQLLRQAPRIDAEFWDHTAAVIDQAFATSEATPRMPDALVARIRAEAPAHFPTPTASPAAPISINDGYFQGARWFLAVGLAGLLLWSFWLLLVPEKSHAEKVYTRLASASDSTRFRSAVAENGPVGEAIWNRGEQTGVLRVQGLPPNDPQQTQYQLWIVDRGRNDPEPVDGGIFDVDADGKATVPIRAALPIFDARALAVTREPRGGVVVSRSPHLVVLTPATGD